MRRKKMCIWFVVADSARASIYAVESLSAGLIPVEGSDFSFRVMLDKAAQKRADPGCFVVCRSDFPFSSSYGVEHFPSRESSLAYIAERVAKIEARRAAEASAAHIVPITKGPLS